MKASLHLLLIPTLHSQNECETDHDESQMQQEPETEPPNTNTQHRDVQTHLTMEGLKQIEDDNKSRMTEKTAT